MTGILLNGIENETKEQKGGFLGILLSILGASLLGRNNKSWLWF